MSRPLPCALCKAAHALRRCSKFVRQTASQRKALVKKLRFCLNCLAKSHQLEDCTSTGRCTVCQAPHHTMLHTEAKARRAKKSAMKSWDARKLVDERNRATLSAKSKLTKTVGAQARLQPENRGKVGSTSKEAKVTHRGKDKPPRSTAKRDDRLKGPKSLLAEVIRGLTL